MLLAFYQVLNLIYWPQVLRSSVRPSDGDSIGTPMYGSILMTIVASPVALGIAWLCLRHYNPATRLATIRPARHATTHCPGTSVAAYLPFNPAGACSNATTSVLTDDDVNGQRSCNSPVRYGPLLRSREPVIVPPLWQACCDRLAA